MGFAKYLDSALLAGHYLGTTVANVAVGGGGIVAGGAGAVVGSVLEAVGTGESEVLGVDLGPAGELGEEMRERGLSRATAGALIAGGAASELVTGEMAMGGTDYDTIDSPFDEVGTARMGLSDQMSRRDLLNEYTRARMRGDSKSAAEWRRLYNQATMDSQMQGTGGEGIMNPVSGGLMKLESTADMLYETSFEESDRTPEDKRMMVDITEGVLLALLGAKFGKVVFTAYKAGNLTTGAAGILAAAVIANKISDEDLQTLMLELDYFEESEGESVEDSPLTEDSDDTESESEPDEPDTEDQEEEEPEEPEIILEDVSLQDTSQFEQREGYNW